MNIYVKNNGDCYLLCRCGREEAVAVPPGGIRLLSLTGDTFTVFLPHSWGCDEAGVHVALETTYTFADLQEEDTVELFREKTAAATVKGMLGHIWYDRGVALCRVAEPTGITYEVAEEATLRQTLRKQYHAELRWSLLWEALLDVGFDLLMELGGTLLLFVLLWLAVGLGTALGIAGGVLLGCLLLTVAIRLVLDVPRQRRQYRQIIARLQPDTIAAFYAKNRRQKVY